ncbi:DUF4097 family beta strand repeat-containing protein [Hymenobacter koreensis]
MKALLAALLLGSAALAASAQSVPAFTSTCDEGHWSNSGQSRYCETRDLTLPAVKSGPLTVDGQRNGGISVKGYSGTEVRVRVKVQAWATDEAMAKAKVGAVQISTANNTLRATGPDESGTTNSGYSVSYELLVPEKQDLALTTHNGGISIANVRGAVTFAAQNGGVNISGDGGDVRGTTRNGGLNITLSGKKWDGKGLDVTTTNGGINWKVPQDYSAQLFTSTQHGPINTDFPVNVQGRIGREIALNLGKGGTSVRAVTTNGGINVSRAGK